MNMYQNLKMLVLRTATLGVLATLAACGGGGSAEDDPCLDNIIFLFICAASSAEGPSDPAQGFADESAKG